MKVGDLVEQDPSVHQLECEPYHGKLGIVMEVGDSGACWVRWQGNCDWDLELKVDLTVVSS